MKGGNADENEGGENTGENEDDMGIEDNDETNAAATKMQAAQRGKKARKDVEKKKIEKEFEDLDPEEANGAATKMQASFRGNQARKQVGGMRGEDGAEDSATGM